MDKGKHLYARISAVLDDEAKEKVTEILDKAMDEIANLYSFPITFDYQCDEPKKKNDDFKVGDVVHLKSGGPEMTIIEITKDLARSAYFDYALSKGAEIGPIPLICLEK